MPPSKNANRGVTTFRGVDPQNSTKLAQIFATHGYHLSKFTLSDGTEITTDQCVQVATGEDLSNTSAPNEMWFAEILDIKTDQRHSAKRKHVYVRIRWFYTPYNLDHYHKTVGKANTCRFGRNEMILSDHIQVIPVAWIVRKARILFFDEEDGNNGAIQITPKDRWYRYHFKTGQGRMVTRKNQSLPRAGCGMPGCELRYSPEDEIQRFCPRWLCREWWHEECLRNREHVEPFSVYSLLRMLQGTPGFGGADDAADGETLVDNSNTLDVDEEFDEELASICSNLLSILKDIERDLIRSKDFEEKNLNLAPTILKNFSDFERIEKVLWCARSPIVRGKEYGVVGTGDLVAKARAILRETAESECWPTEERVAPFAASFKRIYSTIEQ
ncbi:unnamed protein product [Rhizoctonia solani]|uniref:BAH domain-containing protein n=1 Tax=Rhizoctonia solani TaxID=456999 RepID=A0A8H3AAZ3_9AGAM|nr:unnamed protein product [Rhizoctonia solani]